MTMQVNDGGTPSVAQETLYNDWKARKGDRVTRHLEIGGTALRHGVVEEAYRSSSSGLGVSLPMYAVRWDDNPGVVERGYLNVDIEREVLQVLTVDQARDMLSVGGLGL